MLAQNLYLFIIQWKFFFLKCFGFWASIFFKKNLYYFFQNIEKTFKK